jgi:pimeloyl-ACP methyl ester carboxylesterase
MTQSAARDIFPRQPERPDWRDRYISEQFFVHRDGSCKAGTYCETYVPAHPYRDGDGRLRLVIYLHGFDMGASRIYGSHIEHLVQQGFYVIYPNFQHGFCRYADDTFTMLRELMQMTLFPYPISPQGWLHNAVASVSRAFAWARLEQTELLTYCFGHSLGGLFALSWPAYAAERVAPALLPEAVVAADPIPDSESLIPPANRIIGRAIGSFKDRVDIVDTGPALHVPTAILHGNDDKIVPKRSWLEPFQHIATAQRAMYLSFSDGHGRPALHADHDQATVDTGFLPEWLGAMFLDGAGVEDTLDWRYIWFGLDQVVRGEARADQLHFDLGAWSDGVPIRTVELFLRGSG